MNCKRRSHAKLLGWPEAEVEALNRRGANSQPKTLRTCERRTSTGGLWRSSLPFGSVQGQPSPTAHERIDLLQSESSLYETPRNASAVVFKHMRTKRSICSKGSLAAVLDPLRGLEVLGARFNVPGSI